MECSFNTWKLLYSSHTADDTDCSLKSLNLHSKAHGSVHLCCCSGTWAKDSWHGPTAPEVTRPPPPLSPLSTTRKHVHQSEQREATCCPSTGQTHSMAPAEPRQALEQEEPTQRAYTHLLYIFIVHMYSSICMVYLPIFIYSSCPALLRVELKKKEELGFLGNVQIFLSFV